LRGLGHRILLVALPLALTVAGCSSGDDNAAEVEALRAQVAELKTQLDAATSTTAASQPSGSTTTTMPVEVATAATTSTTTSPTETVEGFVADYVAALQIDDYVYLTQRLHPRLKETYGEDQCRDSIEAAGADPAYMIEVESVTGPSEWSIRIDGIDYTFEDVYTLGTRTTTSSGTTSPDLHVALVDGRFHWFTDCGEPLPADVAVPAGSLTSIGGDTTSSAFDAPGSWRIEVRTSDFCGVMVKRDDDGSSVELKSGESDFVIQIRESGRFYIETTGCESALALVN